MTVTRGIAAGAMLAGLALGTASTAWADPPTMSGHYINTQTYPDGTQITSDWYVTPCGDGCISVALGNPNQGPAQGHLVDGQWTFDTVESITCVDGAKFPNAISVHRVWDPVTLAGTLQSTNTVPVCGRPVGYQETRKIQLTQAP
jgi:hypothetical protein